MRDVDDTFILAVPINLKPSQVVAAAMTQTNTGAEPVCRNCGAALVGDYCHACGQKRLTDNDRGLLHLLGEAFHVLTDVDGKLLRSLRLLLFSPGTLSREYLDDRRVRYTSPISLFLLANVLYFFAPALTDFNLPFAYQVPEAIALQSLDPTASDHAERVKDMINSAGQKHSRWTVPLLERMLAARAASQPGYNLRKLADDYDHEAGLVGKVLMIVHVPIMALALALVYVRRRRYFVEHFVVALHLFTFLLLYMQLVGLPLQWLSAHTAVRIPAPFSAALPLAVAGVLFAYILLACRKAYRSSWGPGAMGLLAVLVGLYVANLWVYRALQFVITLALI